MTIEYKRNLNGSYMIIKDAEYSYENTELLMLLNNKIPGLLDLQVIISNGKVEYWYDITGTTSLGTMCELFSLDGIKIRRLIEDIYDMNRQLEDYMLEGENIRYLPEQIYFDRATEKYRFCYLPGCMVLEENMLQTLTEFLLTKIDHKDQDAVAIGYALYEKSLQESCSAKELLVCTCIEEICTESASEGTQGIVEEDVLPIKEMDCRNVVQEEPEAVVGKKSIFGKRAFKTKKTNQKKQITQNDKKECMDYSQVLAEMKCTEIVAEPDCRKNPTVFLNLEKHIQIGKLIYQGEGKEENFLLEEENFLVGKDSEKANGVLRADTVSRIHARIFRREGCYYIEDLNSTNGTYLNGKELVYHEPVKLEFLDRITFATEEYLFS